jgi:hypothetical protein
MSWGHGWGYGNSAGVRPLGSYAQAKEHYEKVRPIQGREQKVKPLGMNRRYSWYCIDKRMRSVEVEGEPLGVWQLSYACSLYGTDCVEFLSNGNIILRTGGYMTPTTLSFINYLLYKDIGEVVSVSGKWYFRSAKDKNTQDLSNPNPETLQFIRANRREDTVLVKEGDRYVVRDKIQEVKYKANRKALNGIKRKYKEFVEYGKAAFAIDTKLSEEFHNQPRANFNLTASYWNSHPVENRAKFFTLLDKFIETKDLEIAYTLANWVGKSWATWGGHCTKEGFIKHFTEVCKYQFTDEVFVAEPVGFGVAFYDRNARYFKK